MIQPSRPGVVMSVVIARVVPAHEPGATRARLDVPGAALVTAGLMAAVFYVSQSPDWGWLGTRTWPALAGALILLAWFVVNEQRARHPLVPLAIFRDRNVSGANVAMAAVFAGNLGMFFLITLYLQLVEHYSAIGTGLAILGLITTAQQMGGAVGLAVISAVAASHTASLTGDSGPQALTSGYDLAMAVAAGITLLASVIAATVIRARRPASAATSRMASVEGHVERQRAPLTRQSTR